VTIQAIQTRYAGHFFRSRLEARWAVFFNAAGIKWVYEPEGYSLKSGLYLPDFYLPDVAIRKGTPGIFAEVKPEYPPTSEQNKYGDLVEATGKGLALLCGTGFLTNHGTYEGFEFSPWACEASPFDSGQNYRWDNMMGFYKCPVCEKVKFEFCEGNYMGCNRCEKGQVDDWPLEPAAIEAQCARFEKE